MAKKYRSYPYFPLKEVKSRPPRKPLELPRLHGLLFHCALLQQAPGDSGMFSSYRSSDWKRASLSATRSASCWAWRHRAICPRWTFCFEDTEMMRKGYPSIYIYKSTQALFGLDLRPSDIKSNDSLLRLNELFIQHQQRLILTSTTSRHQKTMLAMQWSQSFGILKSWGPANNNPPSAMHLRQLQWKQAETGRPVASGKYNIAQCFRTSQRIQTCRLSEIFKVAL